MPVGEMYILLIVYKSDVVSIKQNTRINMRGTHIEFRDIKARTNTCHARRTPQVRKSEDDPNELWRGLLDKRDTWAVMEPCALQLVVLLWTCRNDLLRIRELGRLVKIKYKKTR